MAKPKLKIVQLLRAFAVLCVVITHTAHELSAMVQSQVKDFNEKLFPGDFGVDLFFVISGFIMVYTCWGIFSKPGSAPEFMRRRIIRIVPLYWIATSLMIAIVVFLPQNVNTATADWHQWLASYLFFPYARQSDGLIRPVLGFGWSLQYEMYFYLLFAIALLIQRKLAVLFVVTALISIFALSALFTGSPGQSGTLFRFLSHTISLEFGAGALLGYAYMSGARISGRLGAFCIIAGVVLLVAAPGFNENVDRLRLFHYGIPAVLMLSAAVHTRGMDALDLPDWSLSIGEASYAIYLTHPFEIGASALAFRKLELLSSLSVLTLIFSYSVAVMIASIAIGMIVHRFVDLPLTGWLRSAWPARG